MANPKGHCETELASELLHFTSTLDQLNTPKDVLDGLHKITNRDLSARCPWRAFVSCSMGRLGRN